MFCSKCGKENQEGAKFCCGCGAPLNQADQPVSAGFESEQVTQQMNADSIVDNKERYISQVPALEQAIPANNNSKIKKSKKKPIIIIAVVLALLVAVLAFLYKDGYIVRCCKCGTIEIDTNGYRRYDMCLSHLYEEIGGSILYTGNTSTETFGFYSDYTFDEFEEDHIPDEGFYFYEWESSDYPIEIEVEITDGAEGGCTAEDFKLAFEETYKDALNAEDVNSVEKDILYNYDMVAIWKDGYLEIVTCTEHAYYSFQIFTEDQACMDNLYRSIKNAIIDTWEDCVIVD